jgi:hypothetical protein
MKDLDIDIEKQNKSILKMFLLTRIEKIFLNYNLLFNKKFVLLL